MNLSPTVILNYSSLILLFLLDHPRIRSLPFMFQNIITLLFATAYEGNAQLKTIYMSAKKLRFHNQAKKYSTRTLEQ